MKILHTADWHVGKTIQGHSRTAEHEAVLAELADVARKEKVDLVLAAGDLVAQGIIEALRCASRTYWIEAACIAAESPGLYLADAAYLSPLANDPDFPAWLAETCERREIRLVLAGQEDVLEALALHREWVGRASGVVLGVDDYSRLRCARDKLAMYDILTHHELPTPATVACDDAAGVAALMAAYEPPWVIKPRFGSGSSGVTLLTTPEQLSRWEGDGDVVLQRFVAADGPELSVACLMSTSKSLMGAIAMERSLSRGTSVWARLQPCNSAASSLATRICAALGATGPCNVQFRPAPDGTLCCHDVNLRFSSSVGLRAQAGFNDAAAAVEMWLGRDSQLSSDAVREDVAVRLLTTQWHDASLTDELRAGAAINPLDARRDRRV
ncbi:MAG: ATP-grasp domain-containing protein [Actinobacteria bacterium]|nr:ATP-grasp domain-containing protein [Actinomycetota bacterium]